MYGKASRAVGGHSRSPAHRWPQPLARALQAAYATLAATVRQAAQREYGWQAAAAGAAAPLRAQQSAEHAGEVIVAEPPTSGPGRPSQQPPRVVS